jgi:hypothetical protein
VIGLELSGRVRDYLGVETTRVETEGAQVVGHVQADAFCEGCGYNLHTQVVTRDERLGILICRCPECGRFTAAASLTPVRHVWLNRLGFGLLMFWILFLLGLFVLLSIFHGVMANGFVHTSVQFQNIAPRANARVWRYYYVERTPPLDRDEASRERFERAVLLLVSVLLGAIAGGLVSVCMWHVHDWRRFVAFAPAFLGVGITFLGWSNDPSARQVQGIVREQIALCLALELIGVLVGLRLGRPLARAALSIILPPKPRQHLAFLWTTDGKQLKL